MRGAAVRVSFRPSLSASGNRLLSGAATGKAIHAASFLRERRMVLDRELFDNPRELERIFLHELAHFIWLRLGNPARRAWESLLSEEYHRRARGELGWSAESRKLQLRRLDLSSRTRKWREYACESFCDSFAWLLGSLVQHAEFTLAASFRRKRARWLGHLLGQSGIPI